MNSLTLGSLFSGSGGFELGGILAGIEPKWNCELEPFCVAVLKKRFPDVKHYNDIREVNGGEIEPVDIITGGFPCQDLSVAGKREGLYGKRSGLYFEAVRIVKEMRAATNGEYPKYFVVENVPGLLSSTEGKDFIICMDMMQELGYIPDAQILDAQFMGVPQRRKRVYITWVQVDYILQRKTNISDSIILQLRTELLQLNLAGLLKAYGVAPKKSAAKKFSDVGDGLRKRIDLFSLQKAEHLKKLQTRSDEIQATYAAEANDSDFIPGEDQTVKAASIIAGMQSDTLIKESRFGNTELSWKSVLEDSLQVVSGCITSTWTKETIEQKIYTCFQALLNTLTATIRLMRSLEKEPMSLNCYEWVQYILTETQEIIDETKKYKRSIGQLDGDDLLRAYEQELRTLGYKAERYFTEECGQEILPQPESLLWNIEAGFKQRQGITCDTQSRVGEAGGDGSGRYNAIDDKSSVMKSAGISDVSMEASVFENHSQDTRYTGPLEVAPSVSATYGTGGNNQPFVVKGETPKILKIRCGCEGGGKGALIQDNTSATLGCNNDQTLFEPKNWDGGQVSPTLTKQNAGGSQRMPDKDNFNCVLEPFGISAKDSNAMKSDNPHSGIYKAKTARTLDGNGGSPACNQGGIAIVEQVPAYHINQRMEGIDLKDKSGAVMASRSDQMQTFVLQGSMIGRKDENGPQGNGINEDVSFTLNVTDRHAVYAMITGSFQQAEEDKSPTLMARDYKAPNAVCYGIGRDAYNQGTNAKFKPSFEKEKEPPLMARGPGAVMKAEPEYTVRRLTPTECARLQGFPDFWCKNLETEKPTDEEVYFWYKVFATYAKATGGKPKTDKQIRTWLKNPYSDSAAYKLWGNGVALPCVFFVLAGIVWADENL